MRIILTGTPGTGKTTISKILSRKLGIELISIKEIVEEKNLLDGIEVDLLELKRAFEFLKDADNYIIEGHLACEIKLPADFVFVLRTDPEKLTKIYKERNYDEEKIKENLLAEMLDYCVQKSEKNYRKVLELDTTYRTIDECVNEIIFAIKNNKEILDSVDYSDKLIAIISGGTPNERRKEDD